MMEKLHRTTAKHQDFLMNIMIKNHVEEKEVWVNNTYTVFVNRHLPCEQIKDGKGNPLLYTWLSIKRNDRMAKPDWRDFQWIKNQLVGEECEGVELYPAESRLADGANQYHIYVFEDQTFRFPFGFTDRIVTQKSPIGETQRKFPANRIPKDLKECEEKVTKFVEELKEKSHD
jgi:hypothetical protein